MLLLPAEQIFADNFVFRLIKTQATLRFVRIIQSLRLVLRWDLQIII